MTQTARSRIVSAALLAIVLVAARQAAAQPSATPPRPAVQPAPPPTASEPPPAGGDGSDLSHINGQPIAVGDHNQYYYRFRRTNLSTNPLGWIFGIYGASLSYGISDHLAVRGDVNYFDPVGDDDVKGFELGAGLPIYFRRTYSGLFLEPGVIVRTFSDSSGDGSDDNTTFGPQVLVGWHWMWDSGLNFAIAVGAGRNFSRHDTASDYDDEEVFPNGYMRFGYAF